MYKIMLLLLFCFGAGSAQVLLRNVESDEAALVFARGFGENVRTELGAAYKLYSYSAGIKNLENVNEDYNYFLNAAFGKKFNYDCYEVVLQVLTSAVSPRLFNLQLKIFSLSNGLIYTFRDSLLPSDEGKTIARYVGGIIKCSVPRYLLCTGVDGSSIQFESAFTAGMLEEYSFEMLDQRGVVVGTVKPEAIKGGVVEAEVDYLPEVKPAALTLASVYLRVFGSGKALQQHSEAIAGLRDADAYRLAQTDKDLNLNRDRLNLQEKLSKTDEELYKTGMDLRTNDWLTLSAGNYSYRQKILHSYFSPNIASGFSPLLYGVQLNLLKTETRPYLIVKSSFRVEKEFLGGTGIKEKHAFSFLQLGVGIEKRFYIWNTVNPGLGIQCSYVSLTDEKENPGTGKAESSRITGINAELSASLSVRLGWFAPFVSASAGYCRLKESAGGTVYWSFAAGAGAGFSLFF